MPHIAEMTLWQAEQSLRKIRLVQSRRICIRIDEKRIHGRQSRGVKPTDARNLHGGWPIGEHGQTVVRRVPRKIEQNIDLILMDLTRNLLWRKEPHIAPYIDALRKLAARAILFICRISVDRKGMPVVGLEQCIAEKCHDMESEIR